MSQSDLGTFLIVGPSHTGKSSLINTIAGVNLARIGNGDGTSVTSDSDSYDINSSVLNSSICLIDVPGFLDSRLSLSDEEIMNIIRLKATESLGSGRQLKGIIITESLSSDLNHVLKTLEKLFNVCGNPVRSSIIVVATKSDFLPMGSKKLDSIISICRDRNIRCIKWSNRLNALSDQDKLVQINDFKTALNSVTTFSPRWIEELRQDIWQIARHLANQQPVPTEKDIVAKANKIAQESPELSVQKIREVDAIEERRELRIKNHGTNWVGKIIDFAIGLPLFGRDSPPEIYYETVQANVKRLQVYSDKEKPGYENFIQIAIERLRPAPIEAFLDQATKIKAQEIRNSLRLR
jgi:GTP-binding protein EngB required for normal cell division